MKHFTKLNKSWAYNLVLVPSVSGKPLKLYIITEDESISCLLAQDVDDKSIYILFVKI